jgi:hypothetical protein
VQQNITITLVVVVLGTEVDPATTSISCHAPASSSWLNQDEDIAKVRRLVRSKACSNSVHFKTVLPRRCCVATLRMAEVAELGGMKLSFLCRSDILRHETIKMVK